jgi:hypothetical protein
MEKLDRKDSKSDPKKEKQEEGGLLYDKLRKLISVVVSQTIQIFNLFKLIQIF